MTGSVISAQIKDKVTALSSMMIIVSLTTTGVVRELELPVSDELKVIKEDFCFLFVGHWLQGSLGQDRKDTGMMLKTFLETFKNKKKQPALILKTSGATPCILDREDLLGKIKEIKNIVNKKNLPEEIIIKIKKKIPIKSFFLVIS